MDSDYVGDTEYYAVLDPNENVDKIVEGRYWSKEEAEDRNAKDITDALLPEEDADPYRHHG